MVVSLDFVEECSTCSVDKLSSFSIGLVSKFFSTLSITFLLLIEVLLDFSEACLTYSVDKLSTSSKSWGVPTEEKSPFKIAS